MENLFNYKCKLTNPSQDSFENYNEHHETIHFKPKYCTVFIYIKFVFYEETKNTKVHLQQTPLKVLDLNFSLIFI